MEPSRYGHLSIVKKEVTGSEADVLQLSREFVFQTL